MGWGRLKHSVQIIDWENNDRHCVGKELGDEWWNQWVKLLEWKLYERSSRSMKGIEC